MDPIGRGVDGPATGQPALGRDPPGREPEGLVDVLHPVAPRGSAFVARDDRRFERAGHRQDQGHVLQPQAQQRLESLDGGQLARGHEARAEAARVVVVARHRHQQPRAALEVVVDELA